jgi:hypothetical protein
MAGNSSSGSDHLADEACGNIDLMLTLQTPKPNVIRRLRIGALLPLHLTYGGLPIIAVDPAGATAGFIEPPEPDKLVACMTDGHLFVAKVLKFEAGTAQVHVYRIPPTI